jgi:galactose mutarotase-like enzyme
MPTVVTGSPGSEAPFKLLTLTDAAARSRVVIAPERGAIITSFCVGERELLYLDQSTLLDASKNVRGGIPILFPSPGKLEADTWRFAGKQGVMRQHGFARNQPWQVVSEAASGHEIKLRLASDSQTLAQFPWQFRLDLGFSLEGRRLRISSRVQNEGESVLPFALGYHPYFHVSDKQHAHIDTRATRAFDNVTKRVGAFTGFDLTANEVDVHLLDHGSSASTLHLPDGARIRLRASPEFSRWVVWTVAGKDFVCLEPWTAPGNALNTGELLSLLSPGAHQEGYIEIELEEQG